MHVHLLTYSFLYLQGFAELFALSHSCVIYATVWRPYTVLSIAERQVAKDAVQSTVVLGFFDFYNLLA